MPYYRYKGAVMEYGRVIARDWEAETFASSPGKAKSNLSYQYKSSHNKSSAYTIKLTGDVIEIGK